MDGKKKKRAHSYQKIEVFIKKKENFCCSFSPVSFTHKNPKGDYHKTLWVLEKLKRELSEYGCAGRGFEFARVLAKGVKRDTCARALDVPWLWVLCEVVTEYFDANSCLDGDFRYWL